MNAHERRETRGRHREKICRGREYASTLKVQSSIRTRRQNHDRRREAVLRARGMFVAVISLAGRTGFVMAPFFRRLRKSLRAGLKRAESGATYGVKPPGVEHRDDRDDYHALASAAQL